MLISLSELSNSLPSSAHRYDSATSKHSSNTSMMTGKEEARVEENAVPFSDHLFVLVIEQII